MLPTFIIADNQDITHAGICRYLFQLFSDPLIRDAKDKEELTQLLLKFPHAVVILDYTLFDFHSVEDLMILSSRFPETHWVLFSHELSESLLTRVSQEPHISILLKENSAEEIHLALRMAAEGRRIICQQVGQLLQSQEEREQMTPLTQTEIEILRLIAKGKSVKEIAALRFSSAHTITTHKKNIFRKLHVNNVYEATRYAFKAGLADMVEYYI